MSSNVQVKLGAVQETLLIPLIARAVESKKPRGLLRDPKAVEIIESVDYDFSRWEKHPALIGAVVRTRMFDGMVRSFLKANPQGTVIEIGAGLNTRYERLDNGQARWLEFDLSDSMDLRRQYFNDDARRRMIAASVLETDWLEEVKKLPEPYFFVSEAVMIYLKPQEATSALGRLAKTFPGGEIAFDTTSKKWIEAQSTQKVKKLMPKNARFQWDCDDPKSLESLGMSLKDSRTMLQADSEIIDQLPLRYRVVFKYMPWIIKHKMVGYNLNLFQFNS